MGSNLETKWSPGKVQFRGRRVDRSRARACCWPSTGRAASRSAPSSSGRCARPSATGRLAAGERLPSSRGLAAELAVSRGLVVDTYAQLEAEGFVVSRVGSGTRRRRRRRRRSRPTPPAPPPVPAAATRRRLRVRRARPRAVPDARLDVGARRGRPGDCPSPSSATRRVPDRSSCAGCWRPTCRGSAARSPTPTTSSSRAGSAKASTSCCGPSPPAASPTSRSRTRARPSTTGSPPGPGWSPVPVAVDERGLDVDALAATPAQAVVVTPAHQCPTGVLLAPERRHALVEWAATTGGVVLEDDYDAEFRYDRQPVGSLQGLAPDRVVAMGTVSKTLASGLRLGWMVVPPALRRGGPRREAAHRAWRAGARPAGARRPRRVGSLRQAPAADARRSTAIVGGCSSTRWRPTRPASS